MCRSAMAFAAVWTAVLLPVAFGSSSIMHNPVTVGQTFIASSADPTSGSTAWALTSHGIAEKLFTVSQEGEIVSQLAESVSKVDELTWDISLKADQFFSDGTAVTAQHVADALTELNTNNNNAAASLGSMTVTVVDGSTVRIASERATPVMDAVLAEWVFVVYLRKDDDFVFTGPYAVETIDKGDDDSVDKIELIPNTHYDRAAERPPLVVQKYPDGQALAQALENGEIDLAFHLPVDELASLRELAGVTVKSFEVGYHFMMFHNTRKPHLSDVRVRKAIDLALDRTALSQELRGGTGTRSLFPDYTPYFLDGTDAHADKSTAEELLDEANWTLVGGKRMKDGEELTINLVAYPQRPGLVIMHPLIEQALTGLGITVNGIITSGDSWDELDAILADKSFDLLMWAQNTLPAGDPQWFLNAFFRSDGGNNHAGLNSSHVDALLDALSTAEAHPERVAAAAAVHGAIHEEVPVSNLVTPEWHIGLSGRLSGYEPWGSDYYIVRADLFLSPTPAPQPTPAPTAPAGGNEVSCASRVLGGLSGVSLMTCML